MIIPRARHQGALCTCSELAKPEHNTWSPDCMRPQAHWPEVDATAVLDSVLSTTLHPVTSSSMIKFTLSKVVDVFSDLPERDTHFLVLPLNPSDVSLLQKPQLSDSQNIPEEDEADFICGADHGSGSSFLFPLPACADSAGLPLGISGSISQTPRLHPAHCPCCSAWTVSNSS
ncbi:hypothetical protein CapIbe_024121 [Capra ibex]